WAMSFLATVGLVFASVVLITPPTSAAAGDVTEGEGQVVNVGELTSIAELRGVHSAYEPGGPENTNLDLSALGLINLTIPTLAQLNLADLIELGVVGQFADSGVGGARGASGAVTEGGLIDLGAGNDPA